MSQLGGWKVIDGGLALHDAFLGAADVDSWCAWCACGYGLGLDGLRGFGGSVIG